MSHSERISPGLAAEPNGRPAKRHDNEEAVRSDGPARKKAKIEAANGHIGHDGSIAKVKQEGGLEEAAKAQAAIAPPTAQSMKLVNVLQQALHQDWHHNIFPFEDFVKKEQGLRLDHESTICPTYHAKGRCPLGNSCPKRHVDLFHPPHSSASHNRDGTKRTVCKHWLRGLCKKGDGCDYLHEYDMRTVPECRFFATFGFCDMSSSGMDRECLYLHRDPKTKRRECEDYRRGFCPKGPECPKKHVRRVICPHYLAGFCPKGKDCKKGHPKVNRPSAQSRRSSPIQTVRPLTAAEAFAPPPHLAERQGRFGGGYNRQDDDEGGYQRGGRAGQWNTQQQQQQAQQTIPQMMQGGFDMNMNGSGGMPGAPPVPPQGTAMLPGFGGGVGASGMDPNDPFAAGALPGFGGTGANMIPAGAGGAQPWQPPQQQQQQDGRGGGGGSGGPRKKFDLSTVLCFKCGEYGHFANHCPNPNKPGQRGGKERTRGAQNYNRDSPSGGQGARY